jgi:hypothetical protein
MFYQVDRVIFNLYSRSKKARIINENATFMGVRERNGRTVNLYMYTSLFLEVLYVDDNSNNEIESISLIGNIALLNSHLEREFKTVFKRPTFSRELSA